MVGLSLGEQNFIKGGIAQDLRTDGRKRLTYRPIFVETGVIPQVYMSDWKVCCTYNHLHAYSSALDVKLERQVVQLE